MDKKRLVYLGVEWAAFVFKSERAAAMLAELQTAGGLAADETGAALASRAALYRKRLLLAAVALLGLGFAAKELLDSTGAGRLGTWAMYAGLCLAALQIRKSTNAPPLSIKALTDAFRKK